MQKISIKTEFIKLGQFLKYVNLISNGGEVKEFLSQNNVYVNEQIENRRGRKLYVNDKIRILDSTFVITEFNER